MRTLALTSPLTQSKDVATAQKALNGGNVFKADYLTGPDATVDGVFGEATARACRRAKFWLGYPEAELDPVYGDKLHGLLTGTRTIPPTYKTRRSARLKAKPAEPKLTLGAKALANLAPHVGKTESPPGSNRVLFSAWYQVTGPWCAMAVTWAYVLAGSSAFAKGSRWAYCPFLVIDARAGRHGLQIIRAADVQPGDIFVVDWQGSGQNPYSFDHTGLCRSKVRPDGSFDTREGNTSSDNRGDQSNGGGLFDRTRRLSQAAFVFIRVGR